MRYEERIAQLEEQLRIAEDALISHTLHSAPSAEQQAAEQQTQQRIAATEAMFKARKEEILRALQTAADNT